MALSTVRGTHIRALANEIYVVDTAIVPNSAEEVISGDCAILQIILVNYGGQAAPKISMTDGNGADFLFTLTPVSSGFPVTAEFPEGLPCTKGLSWICDTASAVKGKVTYRRP